MRGDRVGQLAGVVDLVDRDQHLRRDLLVELDVLLELRDDGASQRLDLLLRARLLADHLRVGLEERLVIGKAHDARPLAAFDEHLDRAVRQLQQLQDRADRADGIDIGGRGIVLRRVLLRHEEDLFVVLHHVFEGPHRLFAADKQRHDHVREHHDIAEWQDGVERGARGFEHMPSFASGRRSILLADGRYDKLCLGWRPAPDRQAAATRCRSPGAPAPAVRRQCRRRPGDRNRCGAVLPSLPRLPD